MGSHDFYDSHHDPNPAKAYQAAVDRAHYEFGHDPYNGTISTTEGFKVVTENIIPEDQAYEYAADRLDDFSKWGQCGAFRVGNPEFSHWMFFGWAAS